MLRKQKWIGLLYHRQIPKNVAWRVTRVIKKTGKSKRLMNLRSLQVWLIKKNYTLPYVKYVPTPSDAVVQRCCSKVFLETSFDNFTKLLLYILLSWLESATNASRYLCVQNSPTHISSCNRCSTSLSLNGHSFLRTRTIYWSSFTVLKAYVALLLQSAQQISCPQRTQLLLLLLTHWMLSFWAVTIVSIGLAATITAFIASIATSLSKGHFIQIFFLATAVNTHISKYAKYVLIFLFIESLRQPLF